MRKIYQKMYLKEKSPAKSLLGGFIHNVILRSCNSESYPLSFKRAGFTLIELLVVVLIIGILAAVALPQYEKTVERARAAEAMQMVASIARANEVYKLANGSYTTDMSALDIQIPGEDVTAHGWGRKETNLFQYGSRTITYPTNSVAIARRLPTDTKYSIVAFDDGTMICYFFSGWENFCKAMGSGVKYDSQSYIIN